MGARKNTTNARSTSSIGHAPIRPSSTRGSQGVGLVGQGHQVLGGAGHGRGGCVGEVPGSGPHGDEIDTGGERIALPRAHWTPQAEQTSSSTTKTLDPRWSITPEEIEAARARPATPSSRFIGYGVSEWVLTAGMNVFIAGHLEADASPHAPPRLVPASGQSKVIVFLGTQAEFVASLRGGASGLRIAGSIFVVLALAPLAIWVLIARRRGARRPTSG